VAGRKRSSCQLTFSTSFEKRPIRAAFLFSRRLPGSWPEVSGECLRLSREARIHSAVSASPTAEQVINASRTARVPAQMTPKHIFLLSSGKMSFYLAAAEATGERRVRVAEARVEEVGIVSPAVLELGLSGLGDSVVEILAGNRADAAILAIDYASKLRIRINGKGKFRDGHLHLEVEESFGNCNQYISRPEQDSAAEKALIHAAVPVKDGMTLKPSERDRIEGARRFIMASASARGADVSHRGGDEGFVHATEREITFPDYPGNNMFATLGNLYEDGRCALLFPAYGAGRSLQIAGQAHVETHAISNDELDTGRSIRVTVEHVIEE
jgi:hypothetical protein